MLVFSRVGIDPPELVRVAGVADLHEPGVELGQVLLDGAEDRRDGEHEDPAVPEERARAEEHAGLLGMGLFVERRDGERRGLGRVDALPEFDVAETGRRPRRTQPHGHDGAMLRREVRRARRIDARKASAGRIR